MLITTAADDIQKRHFDFLGSSENKVYANRLLDDSHEMPSLIFTEN